MSKLRIGIIGAGGRGINSFGENIVKEFADQAEVVGIADPNGERVNAGKAYLQRPDITWHADAEALCQRKDVDAVIITTPDYLHEEGALTAFKHGKHVLVDKPLATTVDGCLRVIEASRQAGKVLYMGFNLRHAPMIRKLKALIDAGTFGDIFSIQAIEHYDGGRTYHSRWNRLMKYSGGLWLHKGSHDFDVLNHFLNPIRPLRVSCFANVFTFKPERLPFTPRPGVEVGPTCSQCAYADECPDVAHYVKMHLGASTQMFNQDTAKVDGYHKDLCMYTSEKDTHDQGIAIVEYQNGVTASHSEYFATPITLRRYLIEGTGAHGETDMDNDIHVYPRWTRDHSIHKIGKETGGHGGADPKMIRDFLGCIAQGQRPRTGGVDGTWAVAVAVAAEKSRAARQTVEISSVLDVTSDLLR